MHTCQFHRFMLALLAVAGLVALGFAVTAAWGLGLVGWTAVAALGMSALLVAGALKVREEWQAARWNAGQRVR